MWVVVVMKMMVTMKASPLLVEGVAHLDGDQHRQRCRHPSLKDVAVLTLKDHVVLWELHEVVGLGGRQGVPGGRKPRGQPEGWGGSTGVGIKEQQLPVPSTVTAGGLCHETSAGRR